MEGGAPVTNTGGFPSTAEPTIAPGLKKKPIERFAGCRVFDVNHQEYMNLMKGKSKWSHWSKISQNLENSTVPILRRYLYNNPSKTVILRNLTTQEMVYFKPRGKNET